MTKITAEQLERSAIVYVRQSTAFQVVDNIESGRRQYGLIERAHQFGWTDVQVIDDRWRNIESSSSLIVPFIPSSNRSLGWRGS